MTILKISNSFLIVVETQNVRNIWTKGLNSGRKSKGIKGEIIRSVLQYTLFSKIYRDRTLTTTLKTDILHLIRKGQKDPDLGGNYMPISPLSIHYKLASCCITQCLWPLFSKVIGQQQKAWLPGNVISSCIIHILNSMEYTDRKKIETLTLFHAGGGECKQHPLTSCSFHLDPLDWGTYFCNQNSSFAM